MSLGFGDVNHKRLPRSARHLVRSLQRRGTGYHRASALRAHVNALEYAVKVDSHPNEATPATPGDPAGLRVRLGTDARDLLRRLAASRNYLVQLALVKELRQTIARRIDTHKKRAARARAARARARGAGTLAAAWGSSARSRARGSWARARTTTAAVPAAVVTAVPAVPEDPPARTRRRGRPGLRLLPRR
jgi:hypothetical protein